jgi:Fe-S-cluster-containing hydrogenase component 2
MAALSRKIYAGDKNLIPAEPQKPESHGGEPAELKGSENDTPEQYMKRIHFKLIYEQDKCMYPTCTRCMDFCPVWGIDMTVEPRVIGSPCMMCNMCDQLCPTGAIYVDPEQMKWQAEIEHYAEKGVKQIYQVYTRHPRFIVGYGRPYGYDPYTREDRGDGTATKK